MGRAVLGWWTRLLLILAAVTLPAGAAELRPFTLTDGSVIVGEIESVQNGIYTIKSPALGTVTLKDSQIRSIGMLSNASAAERTPPKHSPTTASIPIDAKQLDALQRRMLGDDSIMKAATALQGDPLLQDILNDQGIMEALRSGNFEALGRNPKVLRLMDDPRVKEIQTKLPQ